MITGYEVPEYHSFEEFMSAAEKHKQAVWCATLSEQMADDARNEFLCGKVVWVDRKPGPIERFFDWILS